MTMFQDLGAAVLSRLDPETAHRMTIDALAAGLGSRQRSPDDPVLAVTLAGVNLPSCVGLAAGFDKSAEVPDALLRAGFGFVEVGSVTPRPQEGNPKPRLFRLRADGAVINRMGFNNDGLEAVASRLEARNRNWGVVGANLGANKDSADRVADYVTGLQRLWGLADYFTVNISSPNTPGLRALQSADSLDDLLGRLAEARAALPGFIPIFVKVAPDLLEGEIDVIMDRCLSHGMNGLVISNTTTSRPDGLMDPQAAEAGGLSGQPLFELSTRILAAFEARNTEKLVLIGAGGVGSGAQAYAKIRAGACAVQIYSALVLNGPGLIGRIKQDLAARLRADGFTSLTDAIGVDVERLA